MAECRLGGRYNSDRRQRQSAVGGAAASRQRRPPPPQPQPLLRFAWKVAPGPCPVRHYGLALAPSVGIPRRVVAAAAAVASAIEGSGGGGDDGGADDVEEEAAGKNNENPPPPPPPPSLTSAQRSLLEAAHRLHCLAVALKAGADEGAIVAALSELRKEAAGALGEAEEAGMVVEG